MNTYFPDLITGYGYLRGAWVLNPSPFVTRYSFDWDVSESTLPSCYAHYNIMTMTNKMMNFFYDMSNSPHTGDMVVSMVVTN